MAVPYALKITDLNQAFTNSVLSILLFAGCWLMLRHASRLLDRRLAVVSAVFGLIFAGMLIIGRNVFLFGNGRLANYTTYVKILFLLPLMAAAVACFIHYVEKWTRRAERSPLEGGTERVLSRIRKKPLIVWGILLISWVPALLAAFPGIYAYDAIYQVNYVMKGFLSVHHPVLHTLWLGGSIKLGQMLFNSNEIGLLLYTVTQMLAFAATMTYILRWLYRHCSAFLTLCAGILFVLVPYNALFAISATKDVMYASLFTIVVMRTYDIVTRPQEFFGHIRAQITYVLWAFGMFSMRHNGFYVFVCMLPFLLIICRKYWKQTVAVGAAAISVWLLFTGPGYKLLHVLDDDITLRESMCVPAQQLARSALNNADELSEEELDLIREYFPRYEHYNPRTADDVKNTTNTEKIEEDPLAFIRLWIKVGLKCPVSYADAWLAMSLGNWYPDQDYPLPNAFHPYMPFDNYTSTGGYGTDFVWVERTSYLPLAEKFYRAIAEKTIHEKFPVISMLFSPGMAFWVLLLTIAACIYRKKTRMIAPLCLIVVACLNVLFGPVVIMRYSYPLILCVPVLLLMCTGEKAARLQ